MEDSKPRQTRRRLDERTWREVLERFDGAAMTVQAYCLREGLTRSSFTRWRARLLSGLKRMAAPVVGTAGAPAPDQAGAETARAARARAVVNFIGRSLEQSD